MMQCEAGQGKVMVAVDILIGFVKGRVSCEERENEEQQGQSQRSQGY